MKTSVKIAFALLCVSIVLACVANFASGNITAGGAYITTLIWVVVAYIWWKNAMEYRQMWKTMVSANWALIEGIEELKKNQKPTGRWLNVDRARIEECLAECSECHRYNTWDDSVECIPDHCEYCGSRNELEDDHGEE